MRGKKLVVFLTLLIFTSAAFNLPSLYAPPTAATALKPQVGFAPPSSQAGDGYPMDLTDSVNDNRTVNLTANNTRVATTYRNATFSGEQLTGSAKVWQNLTLTQLQATYDARAIQGGSSSTESLGARNQTAANRKLAMRFTTLDKVNLTGVWMYYSLGGSSGIPFSIGELATNTSTPQGASTIGGGTVPATAGGDSWFFVQLYSPATLTRNKYYWLIVDASALNGFWFNWYFLRDSGGVEDGLFGSAYRPTVGWYNETQMIDNGWVPDYVNLMLVLKVIPVDDSLNIRQYSSPQQVNMYLNSAGNPITANSSRISNVFNTFVLCTNTSVTFTARWDARFEKTQTSVAATNFIADNGLTLWNVTFASGAMPANLYTLYNRTLRVFTVPGYWAIQPSNVSNTGVVTSFTASFVPWSGYVFIVQGGNPDADPWVDAWLIKAKSTYEITATLPSQVVAGLPLTVSIGTAPYSPSWCNVTFYNAVDYPYYSRNITIPSNSIQLTLKLNVSGSYTLFLFDRWTGGNEASLNSTLTVAVLPPLCNVSVISTNEPLPGNTASIRFQFHNNSKGGEHMSPDSVRINGTSTSFTYSGEVVTANWSTATGGWHVGLNHVNVSATSGVFSNATIAALTILEPLCNVTVVYRFSPVLGNIAELRFKFYNNSLGTGNTWMQPEAVSVNGTLISFAYDSPSGVASIWLSTASSMWHAGNNTLVVSAKAGIFNASLNTWVSVIAPISSIEVTGHVDPVLGNNASVSFKFHNQTAGGATLNPESVRINGTSMSFVYSSIDGVTSVTWNTTTGGWHQGLNYVNVSATIGRFSNFTVTLIDIIQPRAELFLNATTYSAIYGDHVVVRFKFLNTTSGGTNPPALPPPDLLYRNGSQISYAVQDGWYMYDLSTRDVFSLAGTYKLEFTASYRSLYVGVNFTTVNVLLIPVSLSIHLDQTSVTAGSSLSVSANLTYTGGAPVPDGTPIVFRFIVTYQNTTVMTFDRTPVTLNGIATSSFPTTADMIEIDVEAIYQSDGKMESASDHQEGITVTQPTGGFTMIAVATVAGIAVFAALVPIALRARRKKGKEEEHRKTAVLRQTASLAQLVVVDLKSGGCVFSRSLGSEEGVDPHLISGFLSANQSILDEVFKKKSKAGLRFADYGDYKVISHVGDYIMVTLFATEAAGEELKSVIEKFTDKFEKKYGKALGSWEGEADAFKDADEIADEVFALQLTSPYMLLEVPSAKLSRSERAAVHFGRILSAERGVFFMPRLVDFLLTKQGLTRGKAMDAINSLTQKGVFRQLTIEQAAQVVKSTLEKSGNQA